ncbi:GTP pyrophosphokinase family protein [Bradyrhizobium sp. ORS 86]|uniref:GTP pyrophosphokinase n=1 Tax=Bradyrhizobium sp. ORS 86 TaxID=1685970 RepID=UPI00388E9CE6
MQDETPGPLAPTLNSSIGEASEATLSDAQVAAIEASYKSALARNQALLDEVVFILRERIAAAGVKIHSIEHRVKELPSIIKKCHRKGSTSLDEVIDVVGARVVSLFRSDMSRIGKIVTESFDVVHVDDKVSQDQGPLGYMSVHYVCKIPSRYKGPRYENTAGIQFEIQVRTLCMHAWAAVSHYLDYKGDWDVPVELKRSLSALSGLFYVADTEFEQFYAARLDSKKGAEQSISASIDTEINLDTVTAFLRRKFPDRQQTEGLSLFVRELKRAGFKSLVEVERDIDRGHAAFLKYEERHPPTRQPYFADLGAARLSLGLASNKYYTQLKKHRKGQPDDLLQFRDIVK